MMAGGAGALAPPDGAPAPHEPATPAAAGDPLPRPGGTAPGFLATRDGPRWAAALRWGAAAVVALGLHAGAAALLVRIARPEPAALGGGDAVAVELDPVEGEAGRPDEAQPAAPDDEASTAAAAAAPAAASRAAPDTPQPPVERPLPAEPPPPERSPPAPPIPAAAPPGDAAVEDVAPPPPPPLVQPPKPPEPQKPEAPATEAARASAPSAASVAADDASPAIRRLSATRETAWRGRLAAHLNRYRRFPPGLGSGTARIAFTVDGDGRVTAVSVASGSGDAALDAAARALVERASPFPPPPAGLAGRALSFVVPVHYDARRP